ncbi:hypothetical protein BT96DRAFT_1025595 [Gymnopus androsaceus JB14]|uniref:Uncharacterized protein n=1 Tax=Gymnopus androsaceus JB14 TaxID=1447944 RepID=A0A6A4GS72_9AGAR|nr:hypothetical protein BT96DRAFT_1025595 [Gymnopus androsaceus JB14]
MTGSSSIKGFPVPSKTSFIPSMKSSLYLRLLLICAAGITQVKTLQVDVPSSWERRCDIPATVTRDLPDDPETFAVAYIEDSLSFTSFFATPTDTSSTAQTVLFAISTPGSFHLEVTDLTHSAVLATSTQFTVTNSIDPCPPV